MQIYNSKYRDGRMTVGCPLSLPVHVRYLTFSLPVLFPTRIESQNNRYIKKECYFLYYIATPTVQGTSSSRTNICFKIVIKS